MPITSLDHFFLRSRELERSRWFYCDALGLEVMPRPDFPFPGYWLGTNGRIQVHMGQDHVPGQASNPTAGSIASVKDDTGPIDHIAFQCTDAHAMGERLAAHGLPFRTRYIAEVRLLQLFVVDPDGLTVELNFPGTTAVPAWASGGDS